MVKFNEQELQVLGYVEQRALVPIKSVAQELGRSEHATRRIVERLFERGVIRGCKAFVNHYALGVQDFTLFCNLSPLKPTHRQKLMKTLRATDEIKWIGVLIGEYQLAIAFFTPTITETRNTLVRLHSQLGDIFSEKTLSVRSTFSHYGRRYLCPGTQGPILQFKHGPSNVSVDKTDRAIISILSDEYFTSYRELSRRVSLSPPALLDRIKRLEHLSVIPGYYYDLSIAHLGVRQYRMLVSIRGIAPKVIDRLHHYAQRSKNVVHTLECFGEWDFELCVEIRDPKELYAIVDEVQSLCETSLVSLRILEAADYLKQT